MDQSLAPAAVSAFDIGLTVVALVLLVLTVAFFMAWRAAASRAAEQAGKANAVTGALDARFSELSRMQSEMKGGVQAMVDSFGSGQADLVRNLSDRLDGLGHRIGQSMGETTKNTHENLSKLQERLAVIDTAQRTITELSGQVVQLQHILNDKQTRGAFGQQRMEAIVQDGLPRGSYAFQVTLSNGKRPDCVILLPGGVPKLVIDSKFPLEAWTAIRAATPENLRAAQVQFRRDLSTHIRSIRDKYFIAGETQDTAFMFVPSESIFAEIHEHFDDIIQDAYRSRVVIVSPSLLMLSVQVVQAVLKDGRMREQASIIRDEVVTLIKDVNKLGVQTKQLQSHFKNTAKDIDQIVGTTDKIMVRGERISSVDIADNTERRLTPAPVPMPAAPSLRTPAEATPTPGLFTAAEVSAAMGPGTETPVSASPRAEPVQPIPVAKAEPVPMTGAVMPPTVVIPIVAAAVVTEAVAETPKSSEPAFVPPVAVTPPTVSAPLPEAVPITAPETIVAIAVEPMLQAGANGATPAIDPLADIVGTPPLPVLDPHEGVSEAAEAAGAAAARFIEELFANPDSLKSIAEPEVAKANGANGAHVDEAGKLNGAAAPVGVLVVDGSGGVRPAGMPGVAGAA